MQVNADECLRLIEAYDKMNAIPIEDVEWVDDAGEPIAVNKSAIEEWKFVGLGARGFVEHVIFGEGWTS